MKKLLLAVSLFLLTAPAWAATLPWWLVRYFINPFFMND